MPRFQKNDKFIDKTFTVIADIVLKVLPASKQKKKHSLIIEMVCLLSPKATMLKL